MWACISVRPSLELLICPFWQRKRVRQCRDAPAQRAKARKLIPNGQQENELEYLDDQDNDGEENEQNGLFR